jgi:hypothetical protein
MKTKKIVILTIKSKVISYKNYIIVVEEFSTLSDGCAFGEKALLTKGKRTANV